MSVQSDHSDNSNSTPVDPSMFDAYAPAKIAEQLETVGLGKTGMGIVPLLMLGILAGAFISFGAMFYTVVMTNSGLGLGVGKMVGGLAFCLGLILVVVGGAELFTGNVLIVMGWAHRKVTTAALLRNWTVVYIGNFIGSVCIAVLGYWSDFMHMGGDAVADTAIKIAEGKVALPFDTAFVRGILCNTLFCLAVWLCFAARSVVDKIVALILPITAFVVLGFEHSIANMYFIPTAILLMSDTTYAGASSLANGAIPDITIAGFFGNLIPVTIGNILGGGVFVALSYYLIYLRGKK